MTDEKIIRITKPEKIAGKTRLRLYFDYYREDGKFDMVPVSIGDYDNLENAPPNDLKKDFEELLSRAWFYSDKMVDSDKNWLYWLWRKHGTNLEDGSE